jgi:predicted Rossmann fold nucleotide-binding protein DprA/Smf involved in DNA uptake
MRIAIVGSRNIKDYDFVNSCFNKILTDENIEDYEIVSGGADGVDSIAREIAINNKKTITEFFPDWKKYGKSAGFVRNKYIVESADILIAIWDGESKGTKNSINTAMKLNKKIFVFKEDQKINPWTQWK